MIFYFEIKNHKFRDLSQKIKRTIIFYKEAV